MTSSPTPVRTPSATPTASATTTSPTASATATPSGESSGASERKALGEFVEFDNVKVRALEVDADPPGQDDDRPGQAALVEVCLKGPDQAILTSRVWTLLDEDGGRYVRSGRGNSDYPHPTYPDSDADVYSPGECARGWIMFVTNDDTNIAAVRYASTKGNIATWTTG